MAFMDAKQARPVDDDAALVPFGWAPGGYHCAACADCGQSHSGSDKRSSRCQDCAETLRDKPAPDRPMTAVDRAELKRLAEGATLGAWTASISGLPEWRNVEYFVESDHPGVNEGDTLVCTTNAPDSRDAAFIAAANPAVVLALLSEIEGLKAERGETEKRASEYFVAMREATDNAAIYKHDKLESERELAALRTQAPDSWRPEVSDDDLAVLSQIIHSEYYYGADSMGEALRRIYLALRPQTAESGK